MQRTESPDPPKAPEDGDVWYDTELKRELIWFGNEWVEYDPAEKFIGDGDEFTVTPRTE